MADRSSERDRRVRQLMGNKNPGFDVLGQAQAEIQDAQSELYNHVALQNSQDQSRLREAATITQAAEGMLAMNNNGDQLSAQAAAMNPSTRATLGKFGVKPSQSQNTSKNVQTQRVVTKSGDTTNIKNENITNNKTDIRITQPSVPVQAPVIPMNAGGGAKREDSTAKFKAWLSGMFARQQNEAEIQRKEYRKKEWNLGRTTSKLMKKIGEATANLGNRLDPKNMTSTLGGQLKWLLLIFGATMIGKVWKPAMKFLANLEGGFRAAFGLPLNEDLRGNAREGISIVDQLKKAIGIDPKSDDTSLIKGIGNVFMEGIQKLIDKLEFWFEDRSMAMKSVEFPDMGNIDFGAMGGVLGGAMEGVVNSLKGIGQYIGDLITVAMGGSKGRVKVEANRVQRRANQALQSTEGKEVSVGDSALGLGNGGRNYMRESDFNAFGELRGNASSTQAMSRSLISAFTDTSGVGHTAEIASGVQQLFNVAERQGDVAIDPELLMYLGVSPADLLTLKNQGMLTQKPYRLIGAKPTEAQETEMGAYNGNGAMIGGSIAGGIGGAVGGAYLGSALGSAVPVIGNIVGGIVGGALGLFLGGGLGAGGGAALDTQIREWTKKGLYPKIVPAESGERSVDGSPGVEIPMWTLTRQGAEAIKGKLTANMTNKTFDTTNQEFWDLIRKRGESISSQLGIIRRGELIDTNNLNVAQAQLRNYEERWDWNFNSTDPNSINQQRYRHWNTTTDNISNLFTTSRGVIADTFRSGGNFLVRKKFGKQDAIRNAAYTINRLVEKHGFSKEAAAGIAGNIMQECGFNPNLRVWDVNDYSGGIVMWHGDNLKEIENHFGKDIRQIPLDQQIDYLADQLKKTSAINRNGIVTQYGLQRGTTVFDLLNRAEDAATAGNMFERAFEGSIDYQRDGNRTRMSYANEALDIYTQHINSGSDFSSIQTGFVTAENPIINLEGMNNNQYSSGSGNFSVGWIGDSQTAAGSPAGLWPKLVGEEIGCSFAYFGRASANANHYLGSLNEENLGNPVTNTGKTTCKSMFEYILNSKPKYVIIALGHNGINGYSNLVSRFRASGIKVIGIKMWSINGSNSGMAVKTPEEMLKLYEGIPADGWVDLTNIDIPKTRDGVHANNEGCKIAAAETLRQLMGVKGEPTPTTSFMDNIIEGAGNILNTIANFIDPNSPEIDPYTNVLLSSNGILTEEQQELVNRYKKYNEYTSSVLSGALLDKGARVDEYGTYIDMGGGLNAYIKEGSVALNGVLTGDDISFVGRRDQSGNLTGVNAEEDRIVRMSVSQTMISALYTYEGKGTSSDVLKAGDAEQFFYLGRFDDIQTFAKSARMEFKRLDSNHKERAQFWVCPTKGLSDIAIIKIKQIRSYLDYDDNDPYLTEAERDKFRWVGPIIYRLGANYVNKFSEKKETTDWDPIALILNIKLTPKAIIEKNKLLYHLSLNKKLYSTQDRYGNNYYKYDNVDLTEQEVKDLIKFGIINPDTKLPYSINDDDEKDFKENSTYFDTHQKYNSVTVDGLLGEGREPQLNFNSDKYFEHLGTTFDDREKFYNDNKDLFFHRNGKIIGPGGVVWGSYTEKDGKIEDNLIPDKETFGNTQVKLGDEGLKRNDHANRVELETRTASSLGVLNYDAAADFLKNINQYNLNDSSFNNRVEQRLYGTGNGRQIQRKTQLKMTGVIGSTKFSYYVFYNFAGELTSCLMDKNQVRDFICKYTGLPLNEVGTLKSGVIKEIRTKNQPELYKELYKKLEKLKDLYNDDSNISRQLKNLDHNSVERILTGMSENPSSSRYDFNKFNEIYSHLLKKGKLVSSIKAPYSLFGDPDLIIEYKDGSKETFKGYGKIVKDLNVGNINIEIQKRIDAARIQRGIDTWDEDNNTYRGSLNALLEKAKNGEIEVTYESDGTVRNKFGTIIDTWDTSKEIDFSDGQYHGSGKGIRKEDLEGNPNLAKDIISGAQAEEYFGNLSGKMAYYRAKYGAEASDGSLWVYNKNRDKRVSINLNENIGSKDFLNSTSVQEIKDGNWTNIDTSNSDTTNAILRSIQESLNEQDDNTVMETILKQIAESSGLLVDQGEEAKRKTAKRILQEGEKLATMYQMEGYLESMAGEEGKEPNKKAVAATAASLANAAATVGLDDHKFVGGQILQTESGAYYLDKAANGGKGVLYALEQNAAGDGIVARRMKEFTTAAFDGEKLTTTKKDGTTYTSIVIDSSQHIGGKSNPETPSTSTVDAAPE